MAAEEKDLRSPFYSISRNSHLGLVLQASVVHDSMSTKQYNPLNHNIQGGVRVPRLWPTVILDSVFEPVPDLPPEVEEKVQIGRSQKIQHQKIQDQYYSR